MNTGDIRADEELLERISNGGRTTDSDARRLPNDKDFALMKSHIQMMTPSPVGVEMIDKNKSVIIELLKEIQNDLTNAFITDDIDSKDRLIDNAEIKIDTIIRFM